MSTELIINASLPETRIALLESGEIQDLVIERAKDKGIVGNIYKGRVTRVLPGMQAAFVDIGLEKAAFLYVDDVFVHSEIWEEEEGSAQNALADIPSDSGPGIIINGAAGAAGAEAAQGAPSDAPSDAIDASAVENAENGEQAPAEASSSESGHSHGGTVVDEKHATSESGLDAVAAEDSEEDEDFDDDSDDEEDDDNEDDDDDVDHGDEPVRMGPPPADGEEGSGSGGDQPSGTVAPSGAGGGEGSSSDSGEGSSADSGANSGEGQQAGAGGAGTGEKGRDRFQRGRRGRRGGRFRRDRNDRGPKKGTAGAGGPGAPASGEPIPENFQDQVMESGDDYSSDRAALSSQSGDAGVAPAEGGRDVAAAAPTEGAAPSSSGSTMPTVTRQEFRAQRSRDRRIRSRSSRPPRVQANIQDLLKEGQEVLVQVAKDPISTKGARLTCHISLPGRHLVCMPTIDHVGVSRRIERDDERRRLRETVDRYRPKGLGFIVRTASGKQAQGEKRVKQDIDYLSAIWDEIKQKTSTVTAPALVYEDLNPVLRAIRDWVTEEIDKIVVDSRYHFNEIIRFVGHFMPSLKHKVELYHGDVPIFDAYNISAELSRALERKVWLKSGGYIVIDQAEALVAIDVNTGRFVGKKNLEDTILKTNLEAVQEIAYQLRLRNCGGIIILDFIDMEKEENRQRVYRALDEALKKDRARPSIMKISDLGLVEMTRKRTRDTMVRTLCEPCSSCEGKGYIKGKATVAYEILRELEREGMERGVSKILVQAHPEVIDILAVDERETLDHLERRFRKQIYLQSVTDFHAEQFEVVGDKKPGTEKSRDQEFRDRAYRDRNDRFRQNRNRSGGGGGGAERDDRDNRDSRFGSRSQRSSGGGSQQNTQPSAAPSGPPGLIQPAIRPVSSQPTLGIVTTSQNADASQNSGSQEGLQGSSQQGNSGGQGNQANSGAGDYSRDENEDTIGNNVSSGFVMPTTSPSGADYNEIAAHPEDFSEEDRLAYLRAQAAQDAAIAKFGAAGVAPGNTAQPNRGGGGGGRFSNNRRGAGGGGGGGGGKGRGGRFNNRNRPRHFGKRDFNQAPGGGGGGGPIAPIGSGAGAGPIEPPSTPSTPPTSAGNGGNGNGGNGGPVDNGQPPA